MDKPNPFAKCASFTDVLDVLRGKAEWLLGFPLEVFEAYRWFVREETLLFRVESSITTLRLYQYCRPDYRAHVGDLLTGEYHQYAEVKSRRVREWDGGGFRGRLEMGSGSGNSDTFSQVFRIPLKHLPLLRKKHEYNRKVREKLEVIRTSIPKRAPEDLRIIAQFEDLQKRDVAWRRAQTDALLKKHGEYDLSTGERTFDVAR